MFNKNSLLTNKYLIFIYRTEIQFEKCHTIIKKIHSKVTTFADIKIDRFYTSQGPIHFIQRHKTLINKILTLRIRILNIRLNGSDIEYKIVTGLFSGHVHISFKWKFCFG